MFRPARPSMICLAAAMLWAQIGYTQTLNMLGAGSVAPVAAGVVSPVKNLGVVSSFGAGQTRTTPAIANAVSTGGLVIVFVFDSNASVSGATVTDTKSNTYTLARAQSPTAGVNIEVFYSFVTTPLTTSDTITYTAATGFVSTTISVSAATTTGYTTGIDSATTNGSNNGFTTTYSVTGAGSAAVSNELYFGFVFSLGTLGSTPAGWTTQPPNFAGAASAFLAAWQINSGTSALTFNGTTTSQFASAIIVSFKP